MLLQLLNRLGDYPGVITLTTNKNASMARSILISNYFPELVIR